MKEFRDLRHYSNYLESVVRSYEKHEKAMLEVVGVHVEEEAKRKFGIYQDAVGEYPAWAPLAEATKQQREYLGFSPDDPLYRTGDLMHSIYHKVIRNSVYIGSDDDIMVYQELGTATIPERPVLGPAMFESKRKIERIIQAALRQWLTGKAPIAKSILPSLSTTR